MALTEEDQVHAKVNTMPTCDFHDGCQAEYDFKTLMGPWANGCHAAWVENRRYSELGTGKGQMLVLNR